MQAPWDHCGPRCADASQLLVFQCASGRAPADVRRTGAVDFGYEGSHSFACWASWHFLGQAQKGWDYVGAPERRGALKNRRFRDRRRVRESLDALGVLAGGGVDEERADAPGVADPPQAVGQRRPGEGTALAAPKGEGLRWPPAVPMVNSPIRMADPVRLHRIAIALLERGGDPADQAPLLEAGLTPNWRDRSCRHGAERPLLARSKVANSGSAKPSLGKTWTSP